MEQITMDKISQEEGYELTRKYVEYFWRTGKFYSLKNRYEMEDLVQEIYCKFLAKGLFEKYDSKITSKKYHVMNSVRTSLIDMLRKYREAYSLDAVNELGLAMGDMIPDKIDIESETAGSVAREAILETISDTTDSKLVGNSPMMGVVKLTNRVIALHLEAGYTPADIAGMFINPRSQKPITTGRVQQIIKQMREDLRASMSLA